MSLILESLLEKTLPPRQQVGGKAWALFGLQQAGFDVPAFFVLTTEVSQAFASGSLPADLIPQLQSALARLCPNGETVAVRSSAVAEDGEDRSFAGQYESILGVPLADVPKRIQEVWQSAASAKLDVYAGELADRIPAVIVQRMVNADAAGVAFSADPVSGRRNVCVVAAVLGLGSNLVSGQVNGDSWQINLQGKILHHAPTEKKQALRLDPTSGQVVTLPVPEPYSQMPALSDEMVSKVAALAVKAGEHFERHQDIEWALENDRLYLLQSRPLTSMGGQPDPEGALRLWDNGQLIDSYSGITTPLTYSFARRFYEAYYYQLCRNLGRGEHEIRGLAPHLERCVGYFRHRLYYDMNELEPILSPLPSIASFEWRGIAALPEQAQQGWHILTLNRKLLGETQQLFQNVNRLLGQSKRPNLNLLRADQLLEYYDDLARAIRTDWQAPVVNDFMASFWHALLTRAVVHWCNDQEAALVNDLLCGETGIVSMEPGLRLQKLAELAGKSPWLLDWLQAPTRPVEQALSQYPEFSVGFNQYLDDFGDRCMEDLKLESTPLSDQPEALLVQIGRLATRAHPQRPEDVQTLRMAAETRWRMLVGHNPIKRMLFGWLLNETRRVVKNRENMRFELTRMMGRIRRIFRTLGRKFCEENILGDAADIFYLTIDEVTGIVSGTTVDQDWKATIARRRSELAGSRELPAPASTFTTRGMVYAGNDFSGVEGHEREALTDSINGLQKGQGCCPGIRQGRVRVVSTPDSGEFQEGEILVAERSDPGWVVLFPSAAGLLFEHGHSLCHAAIVAREMGIPTVVALQGVTRWLQDGDWIEMDGRAGTVRKIGNPGQSA